MNFKKVNYCWSFVGGFIFLLLTKADFSFFVRRPIFSLLAALAGVLCLAFIVFLFNNLETKKQKNIFLIIFLFSLPLGFWGAKFGDTLGTTEKLLFCSVPFLVAASLAVFLLKSKKDLLFRIIAVVSIFLCLFAVSLAYKDFLSKDKFVCRLRGGVYMDGGCLIENFYSLKRSLFGTVIFLPGQNSQAVFLDQRRGDYLSGLAENQGKTEVKLFPEKALFVNSRTITIPFSAERNGQSEYYLGLFKISGGDTPSGEKYFAGAKHLSSYHIGDEIELGDTKKDGQGSYEDFIIQEYFDQGNKKEIRLRIGYDFEENKEIIFSDKKCEEVGSVGERTKGDGTIYKICILGEDKICELEAYNSGNCYPGGVDISKLNNEAEIYCSITGHIFGSGRTCLVNGEECLMEDYYNGKCR